jgi:DNA-binding NtrC family response regulator
MSSLLVISAVAESLPLLQECARHLDMDMHAVADTSSAVEQLTLPGAISPDIILLHIAEPEIAYTAQLDTLTRIARRSRILVTMPLSLRPIGLEALKCGAHDFLCLPLQKEKLTSALRHLIQSEKDNRSVSPVDGLVGVSPSLTHLQLRARAYAQGTRHLLIRGERGVGKTHLALMLQQENPLGEASVIAHSYRDDTHFQQLLEHAGEGRTLILDLPERSNNITGQPLNLVKLCEEASAYHIRIFFCQHTSRRGRKPSLMMPDESILVPLLYPPLRTRPEDIVAQFSVFNRRSATMLNRTPLTLCDEGLSLLLHHDWSGNTRDLQFLVFQLYMMQDGPRIELQNIQSLFHRQPMPTPYLASSNPHPSSSSPTIPLLNDNGDLRAWDAIETDYIREAFQFYRGHKSEIARKTGMGRSTLYRKTKHLKLHG